MTSISTLTPTQYKELYGSQAVLTGQPTMVDTAVSVLSQNNTSSTSSSSSDGADDGKISFWSGIKSAIKGVGKTIINAVKSLNPLKPENWWNIIKTAGCVALAIWFPPAGVAMACIAGAKGLVTVGKGAVAAHNATTDAEAEAAWENIGSGSFQVAMSVVGAKAALKAMKATPGSSMEKLAADTAKSGTKATFKQTRTAMWEDFKTFGRGATEKTAWSKLGSKIGYKSAGFADKISNAYENSTKGGYISKSIDAIKEGTKSAFKETRIGKEFVKLSEKAENVKKNATTGKETMTSKVQRLEKAVKEVHKENQLARQAAKDAEIELKAQENLDKANKDLENFQNKYDVENPVDGKFKVKTGEGESITVEEYNAKLEQLQTISKDAQTRINEMKTIQTRAEEAMKTAEQELDNYTKAYKKIDGKYVDNQGKTIEIKAYQKRYNELLEAKTKASNSAYEADKLMQEAKDGINLRTLRNNEINSLKEQINEAKAKNLDTIKSLETELKKMENSVIDSSKYNDVYSRAKYNAITGRTSLFKTASANWRDAAVTSHYDSIFATTKPAISLLFKEANSGSDIAKIQLQQLGYNVY